MKVFTPVLAAPFIIAGMVYYLTRTPAPYAAQPATESPNVGVVRSYKILPGTFSKDDHHPPAPFDKPLTPAFEHLLSLTHEAFKRLPRQSDPGRHDPTSFEYPPEEFIARLKPLIDIDKAIKGNPELTNDGIEFYRQCALYVGFHTAVRARCLSHYISLSRRQNKPMNVKEFDERIQKLARAFPG